MLACRHTATCSLYANAKNIRDSHVFHFPYHDIVALHFCLLICQLIVLHFEAERGNKKGLESINIGEYLWGCKNIIVYIYVIYNLYIFV